MTGGDGPDERREAVCVSGQEKRLDVPEGAARAAVVQEVGEILDGAAPLSLFKGVPLFSGELTKAASPQSSYRGRAMSEAERPEKFWWVVEGIRGNSWIVPKCTWREILTTIKALNALPGNEVFAPLHRAEGGFMCVSGPGFESDESVEGSLLTEGAESKKTWSRKAMRFQDVFNDTWHWPSCNHSFSMASPDDVIFAGGEIIRVEFEGQSCARWTKKRCSELLDVIAKELKWEPFSRRSRGYTRGRKRKLVIKSKDLRKSQHE